MRRTTPDLVGQRKTIYQAVSAALLALTIGYVLWTNYVFFVGGNLPLTSISLGGGSTGAGLTMLFIGDLAAVMLLWFLLDGVVLNLLHMVLRAGGRNHRITVQTPGQFQPPQPDQPQPPQSQPGHPQNQPQNQWQSQPGQPQNQWQSQNPWQPQNQGQPSGPPPPTGPGAGSSAQATLLRPDGTAWPPPPPGAPPTS